jgi:prepilin-type N-terminal cleavage/methylation domain-containing protein
MQGRRGVTLLEMMIVVLLISLLSAISYPSVKAGVATLRLNGAADEIVGVLNASLARAESRQVMAEIWFLPKDNAVLVRSTDRQMARRYDLPQDIRIKQVFPQIPGDPENPRRFLLYPGGSIPAMGVGIVSVDGGRRLILVDPITGVPRTERPVEDIPDR